MTISLIDILGSLAISFWDSVVDPVTMMILIVTKIRMKPYYTICRVLTNRWGNDLFLRKEMFATL